MENSQNNSRVIYIGIGLIFLVMVFTVMRPVIFSKKKADTNQSSAIEDKIDTSLEISSDELWKRIFDDEKIKILDVREPDLFNSSHILDSKNIQAENINQDLVNFDKSLSYILIDESGDPKMAELVEVFKSAGFGDVHYLSGGLANWRNENRQTMVDADPYSFTDQAKVKYITADDLKKGLEQKPNAVVIDLRKDKTFADGHIKDSINIYLGDLEERRKELPTGKQLILVDNDGLWAFKGAVKLFDMGFLNVLALSDGLDKWKEKGYEIVK